MARTHEKVRYAPESKVTRHTRETAAEGVEQALKLLEGRWKLVILFHPVRRQDIALLRP